VSVEMLADGWYGLNCEKPQTGAWLFRVTPDNGHCKILKVVRRAACPDDRGIRKLRPTRR